ncbi:MAG: sensor histidine kinase [Lentisphaerae bacterium]|nr:MAG: sensor histidine kinase [Lentisphaerota bacterium]
MKLTTKIGLSFLIAIILVGGGLGLWGIPWLRSYLIDREVEYAKSFLLRETQYAQKQLNLFQKHAQTEGWQKEQWNIAVQGLFQQLNEIFSQHYAHLTGRLFILNEMGQVLLSTDATRNGKTITNFWIYNDGTRGQILKSFKSDLKFAQIIRMFPVTEVTEQGHEEKTIFVSIIQSSWNRERYFLCISENNSDLYQFATLATHALELTVAITILIFYIMFQLVYSNLRNRYDRILEHARMIAEGNYQTQINDDRNDEIGQLAQTIDALSRRLKAEKEMEKNYLQMQKMEMVGTLASGIAHDFNNMLTGILSGLDLILQELDHPSDGKTVNLQQLRNSIKITRNCAIRGKETVEKLLSFSRKQGLDVHPVDLNAVARAVVELCRHSFDKRIKIILHELDKPAMIKADHSLLEQAIMNICINARDAIGEKNGYVELSVDMETGKGHRPKKYLLKIRDNGCGMDEDTRRRLFEPFYTTKTSGTGLGMAMVYLTIQEIGGTLEVESALGKGTLITIKLPALPDDQSTEEGLPGESTGHKPGTAQKQASASAATDTTHPISSLPPRAIDPNAPAVLVIDDDEFMLQMTSDILTRLGYQPYAAPNGKEGLEMLEEHKERIKIVILDLMLPEESGDEIFPKLKTLQPELKVLLVSGNKRDPRIAALLANGCDSFLNKPFSLDDLKGALEQLDSNESTNSSGTSSPSTTPN